MRLQRVRHDLVTEQQFIQAIPIQNISFTFVGYKIAPKVEFRMLVKMWSFNLGMYFPLKIDLQRIII